jgi:lysophospholipase L1-like esterase
MKYFLLLFISGLLNIAGFAQTIDPSNYQSPVKVACIGNSITYGSGIADRAQDSYPAQLGRMLGDKWIVKNFGVSGRTMLKKGDFPYWKEGAWVEAKEFLPDVVIIKLGTNDTKPQNWKFAGEFLSDSRAMVRELKNLPSHPVIYLCKPVPAYASRWGINDSIIVHGVIPAVEKLASEEHLQVIDLYSALTGFANLFPDQIHPNAEGAGLMAKYICKQLTGKDPEIAPAQSLKVPTPLDSRNYHSYRSRIHNAQIVFEREKFGRVAFLGGSITQGSGWRDSVCAYLQKRFPNTRFDFIQAGIASMGSTPGAFRFERDVLAKGRVDLLFEEAAVNDRTNGFSTEMQILGMEGIVRHARESNPAMEVVLMHFADPGMMTDYRKGIIPAEIQNHEKVAIHYGLSTINLAKEVTERIDKGEFSWEKDFKDVHPSPFGHHIYFRSMKKFMDNCWRGIVTDEDKIVDYKLPGKLMEGCYDKGKLIPATEVKRAKGWRVEKEWKPVDKTGTRPDFTNVPMLIAEGHTGILTYKFKGNAVGIAVAAGPDAGMIEYRIDKNPWQKQDLYTSWSKDLHLPWFYTLGYNLTPGKHQLQIRVMPEKNAKSKGNACRVRYFYVNEK